jgi:anhydro-N-acetylmuramic acid kinase
MRSLSEGLGEVDALGFHGQTLAHDPENRRTHQAGDGARLAKATGRMVIWDFRSTDVEMGGQGAPLAPFYHWACARRIAADGPVAFLNLGGVGNITWTDPRAGAPEAPGACLAFDTGPANAPMDDLMHLRGLGAFDHEGALASSGRVSRDVVRAAMGDRFFARMPPKSWTGTILRDFWTWCPTCPTPMRWRRWPRSRGGGAARDDASAVAARARAGHGRRAAQRGDDGGPARGAACPVDPVEAVGLDGDHLEAQAFAYLAARVLRGLPTSAPGTTGVAAPVGGGRKSVP